MSTTDPLITICRDPRDRESARIRMSKLDGVGFDAYGDGHRTKLPRHMLVAFIAPTDIVDGEIRRPASHGPAPDRVKVAITRTQNQVAYPILERTAAAPPPPRRRIRPNAPAIPR